MIAVREERPEDFGFRPANPEGITNQWGIDDPAWMVRGELAPGEVRYPDAFVSHG